jgi:tetratricopeptide (TPR) repeat protein
MKRMILVGLILAAALTGCKQQQQTQWGSGQGGQRPVVTPAPLVRSSEEIQQLQTLAQANPKNAEAWIALGNAQMDAQLYAEAIIAYQKALELDPKNTNVRVDMGTCYRGVGQPERALEEYQKAIKINPRHPNAYMNSGVVLSYDLHRPKEAIKAFEKYLEVFPTSPNADAIRQEIQKLKTPQ